MLNRSIIITTVAIGLSGCSLVVRGALDDDDPQRADGGVVIDSAARPDGPGAVDADLAVREDSAPIEPVSVAYWGEGDGAGPLLIGEQVFFEVAVGETAPVSSELFGVEEVGNGTASVRQWPCVNETPQRLRCTIPPGTDDGPVELFVHAAPMGSDLTINVDRALMAGMEGERTIQTFSAVDIGQVGQALPLEEPVASRKLIVSPSGRYLLVATTADGAHSLVVVDLVTRARARLSDKLLIDPDATFGLFLPKFHQPDEEPVPLDEAPPPPGDPPMPPQGAEAVFVPEERLMILTRETSQRLVSVTLPSLPDTLKDNQVLPVEPVGTDALGSLAQLDWLRAHGRIWLLGRTAGTLKLVYQEAGAFIVNDVPVSGTVLSFAPVLIPDELGEGFLVLTHTNGVRRLQLFRLLFNGTPEPLLQEAVVTSPEALEPTGLMAFRGVPLFGYSYGFLSTNGRLLHYGELSFSGNGSLGITLHDVELPTPPLLAAVTMPVGLGRRQVIAGAPEKWDPETASIAYYFAVSWPGRPQDQVGPQSFNLVGDFKHHPVKDRVFALASEGIRQYGYSPGAQTFDLEVTWPLLFELSVLQLTECFVVLQP